MMKALVISASVMTLAIGQAAHAQGRNDQPALAAADNEDEGIADIVVTATRQATNMQDTPLAITAVTSQTLSERGIASVSELSSVVPNATFRRAQGAYGPGVTTYIRGIGAGDTSLGGEPSVAYYVDDVYYPLLLGSNFDLLDLDHIEVLRGPQGTLFGRNALAGAVNIVSRQPSFTEASGMAEISIGAYNRRDLRASVNLPLTETLAISVSGLSRQRRGYQDRLDFRCQMIKNGTPALAGNIPYSDILKFPANNGAPADCVVGHLGGEDVYATRGALRWAPASGVSLTISGDYTNDSSENAADYIYAIPSPGSASANVKNAALFVGGPGFAYDSRFLTGDPYKTYATYSDPIASGTVIPGNTFYNGFSSARGGISVPPYSSVVNWGFSGKLVVELAHDIDLIAIGGYRSIDTSYTFDNDGSPLNVETVRNTVGEQYKNFELRLTGKRGWVNWVLGGFYFDGEGYTRGINSSVQNSLFRVQNSYYHPTSKAVFANLVLHPLGERFGVTLGSRYSNDKKAVDFNFSTDTNVGNIIFKVTPQDTRFDWKAGLDYKATDNIMAFASVSTGARLPGFNARPQQPSQNVQFPGEETLAYEAGFKADLLDRKLRLNATVFYTDYRTRISSISGQEYLLDANGQPTRGTQIAIPLPAGGPSATTCRAQTQAEIEAGVAGFRCIGRSYYVNTPGKAKGFEIELDARPINGLSINGAIGYSKFSSPDLQVAGRANDRLLGIPEWNANAGIQYRAEAARLDGAVTPRLDWFYTGNIKNSGANALFDQPAYSVVNGRITYDNNKYAFSMSFGATNLFNKLFYRNFFTLSDFGFPNTQAQPAPPREWYLTINKRF